MQQANACYCAGEWAKAAQLCSLILNRLGTHADALNLLGIIAAQTGHLTEAAGLLQRAVNAEPSNATAHVNYGNVLKALERSEAALESYDRALQLQPDLAEAHNNRGTVLKDLKRPEAALDSYDRALRLRPEFAEAYNNRGDAQWELKRFEAALQSYDRALQLKPDFAEAYNNRANAQWELKHFEAALESCERALRLKPDFAEAYNNRGLALHELKRFEAALQSYEQALQAKPGYAEAYNNRGNAQRELKRFEAALQSYDRALQLKPDYAAAYNNRGTVLKDLRRFEAALESCEHALQLRPDYAEAYINYGAALHELKRFEAALRSCERALQLKPDYAEACINCGAALHELKRFEAALDSYDRALQLKPDYAEAYYNRGNLHKELRRFEAALDSYDRALQLKPDYVEAYYNRGNLLKELKRFEPALEDYQRALDINPDHDWLYGTLLHTQMFLCGWHAFDSQVSQLASKIEQAERTITPFAVLALLDSVSLQRQVAQTFVRRLFPECDDLSPIGKRTRRKKIRIGYYSSDFREHAVALLAAELFERHDKDRFELIAFSFGPDRHDYMRERLMGAFDRFCEVRMKSDTEVARISRELGIDIAVDLNGFTKDARPGVFAYRAAPVQVSYLGYPGTMGAPYIDYLIADHVLIPECSRHEYSEKIVYLPNSYQVNDRLRQISTTEPSRKDLGLPSEGFVFCCFNNTYKITPATFDVWMRILSRVEGSVLWLASGNETVIGNLRREAENRGVCGARLRFASRMPFLQDHLARYRAADLFLDTLPFNAHATASDALWVGLPVLTRIGESFAARVAASLLSAIGLSELITTTPENYEALAVELASSAAWLAELREKLQRNRAVAPLFDTELFTSHIEDAYCQMYERYQADLSPEHLFIAQ